MTVLQENLLMLGLVGGGFFLSGVVAVLVIQSIITNRAKNKLMPSDARFIADDPSRPNAWLTESIADLMTREYCIDCCEPRLWRCIDTGRYSGILGAPLRKICLQEVYPQNGRPRRIEIGCADRSIAEGTCCHLKLRSVPEGSPASFQDRYIMIDKIVLSPKYDPDPEFKK